MISGRRVGISILDEEGDGYDAQSGDDRALHEADHSHHDGR